MDELYPALYAGANDTSTAAQRKFLLLIRAEYLLLLLCAILSLDIYDTADYFAAYAVVLVFSLGVLIFRSLTHFEKDWYQARALTESIKTSTWRYMMRAHPYDGSDSEARTAFRHHLASILEANRTIGTLGNGKHADASQITIRMAEIRLLPLVERRELYHTKRIEEQRRWYAGKALGNKKAFNRWFGISITAYIVAIVLALSHIAQPEVKFLPTEPFLVVASSLVGWVQVKKHRELSTSYTLTAYEIGLTDDKITEVMDESSLSDFINETELAFSREHTQWVARQQTAVE